MNEFQSGPNPDPDPGTSHLLALAQAYAGQAADDEPGKPSAALTAYLRWSDPPAAAATAAELRELASRGAQSAGKLASWLPSSQTSWLLTVADLCENAVQAGFPPAADPVTHWEWNRRFPDLGQLIGCYFSQDFPDEFAGHDEAIDAWSASAGGQARARVTGQIRELLALGLDDAELDGGLAELGLEVDLPLHPADWLGHVAARIAAPPAQPGAPPGASG
ncbi:MAG: hypothetical protein J2P25_12920 [Nocardiopsaceae bacterium]|nr:hypothetical protein [Nocardiopsaceae bacterium]